MTEHLTQAIVLSKKPFGEADARISVYARDLGKIEVIAKGIRKQEAKFSHHLEPFNLVEGLVLVNRHYHLKSLITKDRFNNLRKNILALERGLRVLDIFDQSVSEPEQDDLLWQKLLGFLKTLDRLAAKENSDFFIRACEIYFLAKFSELVGVFPEIENLKDKIGLKEKTALKNILETNIFKNLNWEIIKKSDLDKLENILIKNLDAVG